METKPLIPKFTNICRDDFSDFYALIAKNIEESLLTAGAIPGKDYTFLDLYRLAQPFVLEKFKDLEFTVQWPPESKD